LTTLLTQNFKQNTTSVLTCSGAWLNNNSAPFVGNHPEKKRYLIQSMGIAITQELLISIEMKLLKSVESLM
jgi:hypothetical protein